MGFKGKAARAAAAAAMIVAMVSVGAAAAHATTYNPPEGGVWHYGFREYSSTPYLYSEYKHDDKTHKASTIKYDGTLKTSGWVTKGNWAKAPEQASNYNGSTNHWYYDVQ